MSLYIFQYIVNFSWTVHDQGLKFLSLIELFALYLLWKFQSKWGTCSGVIKCTIIKMSLYKVSIAIFFSKVLLFLVRNTIDKWKLFLTSLLLEKFSFFSYSLKTASSTTAAARVAFVSLYTKINKCLSNYMNVKQVNGEWIKLKAITCFNRGLNGEQTLIFVFIPPQFLIVKLFSFLLHVIKKWRFSYSVSFIRHL